MTPLDKLFSFPMVLVHAEDEDMNSRLGLPSNSNDEDKYEIIEGEAEYPYYDFVGIEDRWLPGRRYLDEARSGSFTGCAVKFANVPQILCPLPKEEFKKRLGDFIENINIKIKQEDQKSISTMRLLSADEAKKIAQVLKGDEDSNDE